MKETECSGINRNIVECKELYDFPERSLKVCINRNIVECKEGHGEDRKVGEKSINRNIVECKVQSGIFLSTRG